MLGWPSPIGMVAVASGVSSCIAAGDGVVGVAAGAKVVGAHCCCCDGCHQCCMNGPGKVVVRLG